MDTEHQESGNLAYILPRKYPTGLNGDWFFKWIRKNNASLHWSEFRNHTVELYQNYLTDSGTTNSFIQGSCSKFCQVVWHEIKKYLHSVIYQLLLLKTDVFLGGKLRSITEVSSACISANMHKLLGWTTYFCAIPYVRWKRYRRSCKCCAGCRTPRKQTFASVIWIYQRSLKILYIFFPIAQIDSWRVYSIYAILRKWLGL